MILSKKILCIEPHGATFFHIRFGRLVRQVDIATPTDLDERLVRGGQISLVLDTVDQRVVQGDLPSSPVLDRRALLREHMRATYPNAAFWGARIVGSTPKGQHYVGLVLQDAREVQPWIERLQALGVHRLTLASLGMEVAAPSRQGLQILAIPTPDFALRQWVYQGGVPIQIRTSPVPLQGLTPSDHWRAELETLTRYLEHQGYTNPVVTVLPPQTPAAFLKGITRFSVPLQGREVAPSFAWGRVARYAMALFLLAFIGREAMVRQAHMETLRALRVTYAQLPEAPLVENIQLFHEFERARAQVNAPLESLTALSQVLPETIRVRSFSWKDNVLTAEMAGDIVQLPEVIQQIQGFRVAVNGHMCRLEGGS